MDFENAEVAWSNNSGFGVLNIDRYPSGDPLIQWNTDPPSKLLLRPRSMHSLMGALFFVDALTERGANLPELIFPCVMGARQDRLNPAGDYLFTAKSIAKEINSRNFPKVTILDPHSDVISALIDRCVVLKSTIYFPYVAPSYAAVISPDNGAEKRASGIATQLGIPLLHGWKKRDVSTGKLSGFGLEPLPKDLPKGKLLVVDDICDGGGTFTGLAKEISGNGRALDLFISHGFFSKGLTPLLYDFDRVICTDSVVGTEVTEQATGEPEQVRLIKRIKKAREGRVIVIPICKTLLTGEIE